jgi:diadenosine tetraphosphate (Ap4A) HIT family hydrolase
MLIDRATLLHSSVMFLQFLPSQRGATAPSTSSTCEGDMHSNLCHFHQPPPGVTYAENETVFGKLLRGEAPAIVWEETSALLAFEDIHPRAPTHGLIIPKRFVESVFDLAGPADLQLLEDMQALAHRLLAAREPAAYAAGDYTLCFHVPPFNSVDHLHLHVLAPRTRMRFWYKWIKYNPDMRWSVGLETVLARVRQGRPAVPYTKPRSLPSLPHHNHKRRK